MNTYPIHKCKFQKIKKRGIPFYENVYNREKNNKVKGEKVWLHMALFYV